MATSAPKGTAARPARKSAGTHGTPCSVSQAIEVVPTARKAAWHRDSWPEPQVSRASELNTTT